MKSRPSTRSRFSAPATAAATSRSTCAPPRSSSRSIAKNPQHPGAAHYLIHAYDDPVHAPLGLRYADAYSKIAPSASHALHMPSHIYVAMGMWDEAAAINERSVKAADARREAKKLDVDQRGFHALLWLVYSLHAAGPLRRRARHPRADGSGRERERIGTDAQSPGARARRVADRKPKVGRSEGAGRSSKGLPKDAAIAELFAIGFAGVRSGNRAAAANAMQQMAALMEEAPVNGAPVRSTPSAAPAAARHYADRARPARGPCTRHPGTGTHPRHPQAHEAHQAPGATGLPTAGAAGDPRVPQVMAQQLEAALLFAEGRREEALVLARQAAVVEAGLPFEFGPPVPVKPVNEQVGEMLMDLRRPREAMEAFELSLKRTPRRTLSLLGLARAAMAVKDIATAQRAYGELRDIWKKADKTLPELKELGLVPPPSFD